MVTITGYALRQTQEGKSFVTLELTGELEMIQSSTTGRFYATAKRCSISSSFTEEIAKTLVGKSIRGRIDRVECAPYEYTVKGTGDAKAGQTDPPWPEQTDPPFSWRRILLFAGEEFCFF